MAQTIPLGLCQCGCGERTTISSQNHARHGWVKDQPMKFVRGHARRKFVTEYVICERGYETPCWIWQGAHNRWGYGHVNRDGRFQMVHRYYYERHVGPIPAGLQLDHLCRVPACVNPAHLEPVTGAENCRRGSHTKLTAALVIEIRSSREPTRLLAARFGVHYDTLWAARTGRSWGAC